MSAEEYLQQIEKIKKMIHNKQIEVSEWKDKAKGNTGQAEGERVQASGDKQKMANAVNAYADLEKEIEALQAELNGILKTIEKLPAKQYDLLHKFYFQGISITSIAEENNKSRSWANSLYKKALKSIENILEERRAVWTDLKNNMNSL